MRQTAVLITLITLFSLLLFGCRQEKEEMLATVTAVAQQPTATPSPTIVVTKTAVSTHTITPTPTFIPLQTATLSLTPTRFPTITPTPTVPPFIVGDVPIDPNLNYTLQPPDRQLLAGLFHDQFDSTFIDEDIKRYYPTGLPELVPIMTDATFYVDYYQSRALFNLIGQGVVGQLNEMQIDLEVDDMPHFSGYRIGASQIELNGDEGSEWLLTISSERYRFIAHLPLLINEEGLFQIIPNDFRVHSYDDPPQNLNFDYDLTGDRLNDIIEVGNYGNGRSAYWESRIYAWDGERIGLLERLDFPVFYGNPNIDVRDSNGDGIDDIYNPITVHDVGFFCHWAETVIYTWPNGQAEHEYINHEPPDTAKCHLWRVTAYPAIMGEERIALLTHALSLPAMQNPTIWDSNFKAFVLIHLGMEYVAQNDLAQATVVLDQLLTLPSDSTIVQTIQEIYEAEQKRPFAFCRQLILNPDRLSLNSFGHAFSNTSLGYAGVYDESAPHLPAICDLDHVLHQYLANMPLPAELPPSQTLNELGIEYQFAQQINLDDDPELEWVGLLSSQLARPVIFDEADGNWQEIWLELSYDDQFVGLKLVETDVTGDNQPDVVAILANELPCSSAESPSIRATLKLLYTKDSSAEFSPAYSDCNNDISFEPKAINTDYFRRRELIPMWKTLSDFTATESILWQYVAELDTAVFTQTDPNIVAKITELLNYLPSNDPEAQPYREHLTYLLGYHYELSGDENHAITVYLDLIQQAPSSPWSWLAWARLEPIK